MEIFEYETPVLIDAAELAAATASGRGVCITGGGCVVEEMQ